VLDKRNIVSGKTIKLKNENFRFHFYFLFLQGQMMLIQIQNNLIIHLIVKHFYYYFKRTM